jgi:hypothetical protein
MREPKWKVIKETTSSVVLGFGNLQLTLLLRLGVLEHLERMDSAGSGAGEAEDLLDVLLKMQMHVRSTWKKSISKLSFLEVNSMYSLLSHFLGNESREGSLRFKKAEKVILVSRKSCLQPNYKFTSLYSHHNF